MDPLTIAALVLRFGVPFVTGLIEKAEKKQLVSLEEWVALLAKIETPFDKLVPEVKP